MEACVVCVDNSEWTRDGDFEPTRFQAQADAINLLAGAKTGANPENTVGVLTCATTSGKSPKVMVTPTPDLGKVLSVMSQIEIEGIVDVCKAAQIAQIALKHRQNKNQRQRVVLFVGSPLAEDSDKLVKVGKKLKKNNVSLDVVSFGDCSVANHDKLDAFVGAVNKDNNSHLVEAPMGSNLCDFLLSTPVVGMGGGGGEGASGAAGATEGAFEYGVDPNIDPELALALRVSMEEEQARQQAAAAAARAAAEAYEDKTNTGEQTAEASAGADTGAAPMDVNDDDLLQQALAMSMQGAEPDKPAEAAPDSEMDGGGNVEEDPDLAMALAMSMTSGAAEPEPADDVTATPEYLASVLGGLPGVDVNDPGIQAAIQAMAEGPSNETNTKEEPPKESQDEEKK